MVVAARATLGFRNLDAGRARARRRASPCCRGPNGAGKTNLLEALYFALTGRSCRTRDRPRADRLRRAAGPGGGGGRATTASAAHVPAASVSRAEGRRHLLDGSPADPATRAALRPPVAVFMPDRLALVKGPPAERRAHLDGFVAALLAGARGAAPALRPGAGAAQRAARPDPRRRAAPAIARRLGRASWPTAGGRADRGPRRGGRRAGAAASPRRPRSSASSGDGELALRAAQRRGRRRGARAPSSRERRDADLAPRLQRLGPAPRRARIALGGRSLRRYGSQGQQRAGLLALLFAEREALLEARRAAAADAARRRDERARPRPPRAARRAPREGGGQALITATEPDHLPAPLRARRGRACRDGRPLGRRRDASAGGVSRRARPPAPARRRAPRRCAREAAPKTLLAAVQGGLGGGRRRADRRRGASRSPSATAWSRSPAATATWAQELDLMQDELLRAAQRGASAERGAAPRRLRFAVDAEPLRSDASHIYA